MVVSRSVEDSLPISLTSRHTFHPQMTVSQSAQSILVLRCVVHAGGWRAFSYADGGVAIRGRCPHYLVQAGVPAVVRR